MQADMDASAYGMRVPTSVLQHIEQTAGAGTDSLGYPWVAKEKPAPIYQDKDEFAFKRMQLLASEEDWAGIGADEAYFDVVHAVPERLHERTERTVRVARRVRFAFVAFSIAQSPPLAARHNFCTACRYLRCEWRRWKARMHHRRNGWSCSNIQAQLMNWILREERRGIRKLACGISA